MENELNEAVEWRWVDDKGRAMTNWKAGNPPPVFDLKDEKGEMHVEVRVKPSESKKKEVTYPYARYSDEWDRAAGRLAISYCPRIKECRDCGAPCIDGQCCTFCGASRRRASERTNS